VRKKRREDQHWNSVNFNIDDVLNLLLHIKFVFCEYFFLYILWWS
jgi:hypothetical protein